MDTESPATQLISYLNRGGSHGYYWLKLPPDQGQKQGVKRTIWFKAGDPPPWPDGDYDLYFGVHPCKGIPTRISQKTGKPISSHLLRASLADIAAINCFFAEFDAKQFEGGKEAALAHIEGLQLAPNVLIDSGGGYHAYWLLNKPRRISDDFTLDLYKSYQRRWVELVGSDPDSKDLARVLRVPGSYNYKYDEPLEVKVMYADWDMPYELTDLVRLLPAENDSVQPMVSQPQPGQTKPVTNSGDPCANWLEKALARLQPGDSDTGRNATGYWLAQQLIWDNVGSADQERVMLDYAARVRDMRKPSYTEEEALKSLESARRATRREPARKRGAPLVTELPAERPPVVTNHKNGKVVSNESPGGAATVTNSDPEEGLKTWKLVYHPFERVRECYDNQEAGDADLLASMYNGLICYDHAESAWYVWKKHYWERDRTGFVYRLVARRVSPQYLHAAAEAQSKELDELSKNLAKRAAALRNKKRMDNVLFLAARHETLAVTGDEWDANPWLLGCANGVIDLKTGVCSPGRPADYIRSHSEVDWQGLDTQSPRWEKFLEEIFKNLEISDFIRRMFGYGITGLTVHHLFPILWGEGRNGKGTMLETLGSVLGSDLATSSQADALMDANKNGEGPKPFIYNLRGKRLVWASESNEGRRINEGLVKQLTGGDRLNVRTLHSKPVEFFPSHLLLLMTNHKPHINADGSAIWRRVFLIPFDREFIDNPDPNNHKQSKADPYLIEELKGEQPGILAWLVRGCLEWQRDGLNAPDAITAATQAYREEEDTTGMWIADNCTVKADLETRAGVLYQDYANWCKSNGVMPMSITSFGKTMKRRFPARESHGWLYAGIGLERIEQTIRIPF